MCLPSGYYSPTHPRVFVRFGRTKGEIQVEKGDFQGDLGGNLPKKNLLFWTPSLRIHNETTLNRVTRCLAKMAQLVRRNRS